MSGIQVPYLKENMVAVGNYYCSTTCKDREWSTRSSQCSDFTCIVSESLSCPVFAGVTGSNQGFVNSQSCRERCPLACMYPTESLQTPAVAQEYATWWMQNFPSQPISMPIVSGSFPVPESRQNQILLVILLGIVIGLTLLWKISH